MEQSHLVHSASGATDFAQGAPTDPSPLSQSVQHPQAAHTNDTSEATRRGSSAGDGEQTGAGVHRADSTISQSHTLTPSRGGTLKKKGTLKKSGSVKRSSSRRSLRAGSVKSLGTGDKEDHADSWDDEMNSAFYTPVPTTGSPTEILANRFQAWRKVLKDLITYFRDIQRSYEARSKSLLTVSNVINNTSLPPVFLTEGGIGDATHVLRDYHKQSLAESNKARTIEEDVIIQLTGLRSDLQQKIKEIKNLAGDFKNAVDKETEGTRRAVRDLQEALGLVDLEPSAIAGKGDPFIIKLGVERQLEKQIDEENYLHRAFLNLENSGRELESIVVGEIQKAYNAYAGILKREADEAYEAVERLRTGPIAMAKDHEWSAFVDNNEHFVDPRLPVRRVENIHYPGKDHPAASEVRAGLLERKSKYLKSYTPGWYVLSPTHLHEFKSADHINAQTPIMSLYLPEQKLGSHSTADSSSHKFMLKGRQAGGLHRGHGWVFRAETYDTMMAWYEDIKNLTEKTGEERNAFVRRHARSVSGGSHKPGSISSDGALDEDEADEVPYSANASQFDQTLPREQKLPERPQPGGRFPSDINIRRNLQVPPPPSSDTSSDDRDVVAAAGALPGSDVPFQGSEQQIKDKEQRADASGGLRRGPAHQHEASIAAPQEVEKDRFPVQQGLSSNKPDLSMPAARNGEVNRFSNQQNIGSPQETYMPIAQKQDYNASPIQQGPNTNTAGRSAVKDETAYNPSYIPPQSNVSAPHGVEYNQQPVQAHGISPEGSGGVAYGIYPPQEPTQAEPDRRRVPSQLIRPDSAYGDWMAPAAAGAGGVAAGMVGAKMYHQREDEISPIAQSPVAQKTIFEPKQEPPAVASNLLDEKVEQGTVTDIVTSTGEAAPYASPSEIEHFGSSPRSPRQTDATKLKGSSPPTAHEPFSFEPSEMTQSMSAQTNEGPKSRPALPHHTSVSTISDLHIPGEYPHPRLTSQRLE
ncbi:MAG: hypothetical protein Q9187_003953 [Circinaria calcarea]